MKWLWGVVIAYAVFVGVLAVYADRHIDAASIQPIPYVAQPANTAAAVTAADRAAVLTRAQRGDAQAEFQVGQWYAQGLGVAQDDATALTWYAKAAEQGFAKAQTSLGWAYHIGRGVRPDAVAAAKWLTLAAIDDPRARRSLADVTRTLTLAQRNTVAREAHAWKPTRRPLPAAGENASAR